MTTVTPHGTTRLRVLRTFADFTDVHSGIPPTMREISELLGLKSKNSGQQHMELLADAGLLADQFPEYVSTPTGRGPSRRFAITALGRRVIEISEESS